MGGNVCEYCDCRALTPIRELSQEHDLALSLVRDIRIARDKGDVPRMAELASRIAAVLGPHAQVEERGLFPALAADFPDQMAALEAEHRQIAAVLGEASSGPPQDPAWPDRLAAALALLGAHIRKEEDGVFPAALASLGPADWETMEDIRARVGNLLPSPA
jgi:hemerythrin-like domain-containing protein